MDFVLLCIIVFPFKFCNHPDEKDRVGCFNLIVSLISCDRLFSVALPHGDVCWSVECNCGTSQVGLFLLTFYM